MKIFFQITTLVLAVFVITACGGDKDITAEVVDSVEASDSVSVDVAATIEAGTEDGKDVVVSESVEEAASETQNETMESHSSEDMDSMMH